MNAIPPVNPVGDVRLPDVLAPPVARLALRQQNLRVLLPVLLHDVNGSLNGLALSTELLSRLLSGTAAAGDATSGANSLLQRTRNELGRLQQALKALANRVDPGSSGGAAPRRAAVAAVLREVQAMLAPAVRRGQLEWHLACGVAADLHVALSAEDAFDLLAAFAIIGIESAQPGGALQLSAIHEGQRFVLELAHDGAVQSGFALELHRELLRAVAAQAGGAVEWQQSGGGSRARLTLPSANA